MLRRSTAGCVLCTVQIAGLQSTRLVGRLSDWVLRYWSCRSARVLRQRIEGCLCLCLCLREGYPPDPRARTAAGHAPAFTKRVASGCMPGPTDGAEQTETGQTVRRRRMRPSSRTATAHPAVRSGSRRPDQRGGQGGIPAQCTDHPGKIVGQRTVQRQPFAGDRMGEAHAGAGQQQA